MSYSGDSNLQERNKTLKGSKTLTVAAMGDIHVGKAGIGPYTDIISEINDKADVLLLCGDLTQGGLPEEAEMLSRQLSQCTVPVIGVLGNHDYSSGHAAEVINILKGEMILLDEEPFEVKGVGFAGVKGFAGGFEMYQQSGFGEKIMKDFIQETLNETLKLEGQLSQLEMKKKVVLLHYAPIRQTLRGEPEEIYPFLGSSRLVDPIDNYNVTVVYHGHAHRGSFEGKTNKGIPVYNVSIPVLHALKPNRQYALHEI